MSIYEFTVGSNMSHFELTCGKDKLRVGQVSRHDNGSFTIIVKTNSGVRKLDGFTTLEAVMGFLIGLNVGENRGGLGIS